MMTPCQSEWEILFHFRHQSFVNWASRIIRGHLLAPYLPISSFVSKKGKLSVQKSDFVFGCLKHMLNSSLCVFNFVDWHFTCFRLHPSLQISICLWSTCWAGSSVCQRSWTWTLKHDPTTRNYPIQNNSKRWVALFLGSCYNCSCS